MTHLVSFMRSLKPETSLQRVPDQSLVADDEGEAERLKSDRITASRASDGTMAMLYIANGRNFKVKMDTLTHEPMNAYWFNPRNGQWKVNGAEIDQRTPFVKASIRDSGADELAFDPPGEPGDGNDWVLIIASSLGNNFVEIETHRAKR